MGQIANQMFIEWCYKIAQKIGRKGNSKKNAVQDKSDVQKKGQSSIEAGQNDAGIK